MNNAATGMNICRSFKHGPRAKPGLWPVSAFFAALLLSACGGDEETPVAPPPPPPPPPQEPNVLPTAAFALDVDLGEVPLEVSFDASSSTDSDGSLVSYAWRFGDGGTGSGVRTTHTYGEPGRYRVDLTVTDDRGDTASARGCRGCLQSPGERTQRRRGHGVVRP